MDLNSLSAVVTGLQSVGQIAKGMISLHTMAEVQSKAIELNEKLIAAQQDVFAAFAAQSALVERIHSLEEHIRQMEAWETEKQRYQLTDLGHGRFVYSLKEQASPPEPSHQICQNCYNQQEKSVLQAETRHPGRVHLLVCHNCGAEIYLHGIRQPEHPPPRVNLRRPR